MENNKAFVAFLENIQKIEGADRIVSADIVLNGIKITQVVVGVDTKPHTPVVYFDSNLCLEQEVIDKIDKKSPDYGKEGFTSLGTYLGKGTRVKVVKLKGVISNGLAVHIDKFFQFLPGFAYKNNGPFEEGYSFTELDGEKICSKYLPPAKTPTSAQGKKGRAYKKPESKIIPNMFHFHVDTDQLPRNIHKINPEQIVAISRKVHGTSAIVSNCLVKRPLTFIEKITKFFGDKDIKTYYKYVYASRTVIKQLDTN